MVNNCERSSPECGYPAGCGGKLRMDYVPPVSRDIQVEATATQGCLGKGGIKPALDEGTSEKLGEGFC